MRTIKTYGVKNLMEWQCLIRCGKTTLHIPFTGGALTEYGVTPAQYATDNPVIQSVIEHSDYFKDNRIILLSSVSDKNPVTRNEKAEATVEPRTVEMASIDDAKEYLCEKFGVKPSRLTSRKSIMAEAATNGILFKITE